MNRDELRALVSMERAAFYVGNPVFALTPSERHAADRCRPPEGSPACATCSDGGVVTVGVGPVDRFGNRHTEEAACPACSAGDTEAVRRVGLPVPVSAADFLPAPVVGARRREPS